MELFDKNKQKTTETVSTAPTSTFASRMTEKKAKASVEDWAKASQNLLTEIEGTYNSWQGGSQGETTYNDVQSRLNTLLASAGGWRTKYASDSRMVSGINDIVTALSRAKEYADGQRKYWSQWESAEAYDGYVKQQEADAAKWKELSGGYVSQRDAQAAKNGLAAFDSLLQEREKTKKANEEKPWWQKAVASFAGTSDTTLPSAGMSEAYKAYQNDTSYREPDERWTEEMRNVFGYLYNTNPEKAYTYATEINNRLNAGEKAEQLEKISAAATKNFGAGVAHTLGSLIIAPLGLADYLSNLTEAAARDTITQDKFVTPFDYSQQASGAISEKLNDISGTIDEDVFVFGGKGLGDVYSLGHSAAQSLLSAYTLGGTGTLIAYIGMSGAAGVDDALARGATPEQALLYGTLVGAAEGVAEKISVQNLLNIKSSKTLAKYMLSVVNKGWEEAVEEGATEIFEKVADALFMADKSRFSAEVQEYMNAGMNREKAMQKAWKSLIGDVIYSAMGGFVTGGTNAALTGGVQTALGKYAEHNSGKVDPSQNRETSEKAPHPIEENTSKETASGGITVEEYDKLLKDAENVQEGESFTVGQTATEDKNEAQEEGAAATEGNIPTGWDAESTRETMAVENKTVMTNADTIPGVDPDVAEMFYSDPDELLQEKRAETETAAIDSPADTEADTVELTLESASKAYGAQAGTMIHTYIDGQDIDDYNRAYRAAYDMGRAGVALSYVMKSNLTSYLKESQRELAYGAGRAAADMEASSLAERNTAAANGKSNRRRGVVKSEGVTLDELRSAFNDTQRTAYKLLSALAEVTGIDIVLYRSESDSEAQGKFKWAEDTIYIDVNAGLRAESNMNDLTRYTMMRTFSHEFTHFLEKWDPVRYNEFRRLVFDKMTEHGRDVNDLIESKMALDADGKMTYEAASREVVAEAMTDILPESDFVRTLCEQHRTVFDKLLEKLKEFIADLAAHFRNFGSRQTPEARALKEQIDGALRYTQDIVKMFDEIALEAVEHYQRTVAEDEITADVKENANFAGISVDSQKDVKKNSNVAEISDENVAVENTGDSFTVSENEQFGSIEISFTEKPSAAEISEAIRGAEPPNNEYAALDNNIAASDNKNAAADRDRGKDEHNAEQRENRETEASGGEEETAAGRHPGTQTETGDGRGVSEEVGGESGIRGETDDISGRLRRLTNPRLYYEEDAYVSPQSGSVEEEEINTLKEYGIEGYVVKKSAWSRESPAHTVGGRVYFREGLSEELRGMFAPHEMIHIMDQLRYESYLDFIERTPDMINMSAHIAQDIFAKVEKHIKANMLKMQKQINSEMADMDSDQLTELFYDEWNAIVYGHIAQGLTEEYKNKLSEAFADFDAYAEELTSIHEQFKRELIAANHTKEDVNHGEEAGEVLSGDRRDGSGDPRLLAGGEAGALPRAGGERNALGDPRERGDETGRHDHRPDAEGDERGYGQGSGESGDLRRDELTAPADATEDATDTNVGDTDEEPAPTLRETVDTAIEQRSAPEARGRNFVIGESLDLPSGEKARYHANVAAIRLIRTLEAEGRQATEEEQITLSKYVGWGGLASAFDSRKSDWAREYAELNELLTEEEYALARGSTLNAHYTDIPIIRAMYDGLRTLGFTGGRMLEPAAGVGHFAGAMPEDLRRSLQSMTMVELDRITGTIAKYLYPEADVRVQGFETVNLPDRFIDAAIGNVPFGNYNVMDKAYPKKITSSIHNYFFAKTLDKVREGGIVMFITSSYTLNSRDSTVRKYLAERADLLGAIRLPDSAFKVNAGTETVTDILILKKRAPGTDYAGEAFLEAPFTGVDYRGGAYINEYFIHHPEMALGKPAMEGNMYRGGALTYKAFDDRGTLAEQITEAFTHIKGRMDYPARPSREKLNFAVERETRKTKENGLTVKDGKVYQNRGGELSEISVPKGSAERIEGMLAIRDAARDLMNYQQQGWKDDIIAEAREKLNYVYDSFVGKYGPINASANRNALRDDPDKFSLFALEQYDSETKTASKSDLFTKNTVAAHRTVTHAADVAEGLIISRNETGGVDLPRIAALTGKSEEDVTRELIDSRLAYKTRDGLVPAEIYLSGNVRAKLREAEAMEAYDSDYHHNVTALREILPEDIPYTDIYVTPGSPWIPGSVYGDFAAHLLGSENTEYNRDVEVYRNAETGTFSIELKRGHLKHSTANTQTWGTPHRSFIELFDAILNSRSVAVRFKLADGTSVIDADATAAANEKMESITREFRDWLWQDEGRRDELTRLYNEVFNAIVTPRYSGEHLTVDGANASKPLRPHQRDAVQRIISSGGNTLLAHKVGAGKTYEMAAAAMKLRQLGLVRKPLFAVPKSLVAQWGSEFMDFFPTARLLVAEAGDFTADRRKIFMNRIANGDYDAVIVSYEQFEKLPISDDFAKGLYREQIDSILAAIEDAKAERGERSLSIKDLEKKRKMLQVKLDKLAGKPKDEDSIAFEQLGVDALFIDEAHNFKNLFYTTAMNNVSGLGNRDGSGRAFDLYTKVRYLQKLNGGRGIVFATATPVMNSMSEMYIMQKYLQPDLLDRLGLTTFDAWAKQFGEVVNGVEIKPSGQGYRVKQSFSRFKNLAELQLLFRDFADVLTDIPGLKIPKMKGGRVNVVVCEPSQYQKDYMKQLEERADHIKNVDPRDDNMLKITSDGRKISYTQRMIDPSLPYEEGCKIFRCADNVLERYRASGETLGTQLIFCDMATPKGIAKTATAAGDDAELDTESAHLYEDIRARLIAGGIPAREIAFIHEADTDAKKKKLFRDMNDGRVRVLIGSTGKMGVGMNAQKRIVAIHHLDAPWRPGDVEQRNGRAFRQGNIHDEVECLTYVTEGSFDARLWDILERKQGFINQIMNGEDVGREAEDTGEVTLSAAEVKALASGSPLILEQVQLETDIRKLESLQRSHRQAVRAARDKLELDRATVTTLQRRIEVGREDVFHIEDTFTDDRFSMTIGKHVYTKKKDAGIALIKAATAKAVEEGYTDIGTFAGMRIRVIKTYEGIKALISGRQGYPFNVYPNNTGYMVNHLIDTVKGLPGRIDQLEKTLEQLKKDIAAGEALIAAPFDKAEELEHKRARYLEVMELLRPKEEQIFSESDSEDEQIQEQARPEDAPTDRELLAMAADAIDADRMVGGEFVPADLSEGERDALRIFREKMDKLEALQIKRTEEGQRYRELQFGANGVKVDRSAAEATLNRMKIYDEQIRRATNDLLDLQNKDVLRRILERAREIVESRERAKAKETLQKWRTAREDTYLRQTYQRAIRREVEQITNWVKDDHNKDAMKHVPAVMRNAVIPFLKSIDLSSAQKLRGGEATLADKKFIAGLSKLSEVTLGHNEIDEIYGAYGDLPPAFYKTVSKLVTDTMKLTQDNAGEYIVYRMSAEQLETLLGVVRSLKKAIQEFNEFHIATMFAHVSDAAESTIAELRGREADNGRTGEADNFLFFRTMRPEYVFERFGRGGRAIYMALRKGQAQLARDAKQILEFAQNTYSAAEVRAWGKEMHTVRLSSGTVRLTTAEIMSFYELAKRPQALKHILGEGIRPSVRKVLKDGAKIKKEKRDDSGHRMTEEDIAALTDVLTPRQRQVADALQKFMQEVGGAWGNYVSVRRFGVEQFGDPHYFPIHSDGRYIDFNGGDKPAAASLYALLNMGFTKQLNEKATDKIVLYDIFDVFSNHMASMAQYHAMALPVSDAMKWFNYAHEELESGRRKETLRDELKRVFGRPEESGGSRTPGYAESFIMGVLRAFNGTEAQGSADDSLALKMLHNYNRAQVAFNLRVAIQQPLSIMRAGTVIDYGSIVKGLHANPKNIARDINEMRTHSGIAAWKALGFYDTNISRGLTDMIKHRITPTEKLTEWGLKGAELADTVTWTAIWSACKKEVSKKHKLSQKDASYWDTVTDLFEDVIYKTQVVDSVLTKNEYMRSKGFVPRTLSSFMGEPMTTANVVLNEIDSFEREKREIGFKETWKRRKKHFTRVMYVYTISQTLNAAVTAIMDAWRDDDDYETFLEKYREAFLGIGGNTERWWEILLGLVDSNLANELILHEKLPIIADASDAVKSILAPFLNHLGANIFSNSRQTTIGQITGYLTSMAEIAADKIFGEDTNYTDYAVIYKLFQGFSGITGIPLAAVTREAISAWNNTVGAMAPSLKVRSYDPGDAASIRYAYRDGYLTAEEAVDALAACGQTASVIRSQIGTWYRGQEISKTQAIKMLQKHGDITDEEITKTVNKWSCVVVTGIKYEEIDDEYLAGRITRKRAIDMYVLYGGMKREEAEKKVRKLSGNK